MIYRQQGREIAAELRATRTADPAAELRKAIARKDLRFLGVAGAMLGVPGVPGQIGNPLVKIRGIHTIEGTSDATWSFEEDAYQDAAEKYAEKYNRLLHAHLLRVNDPAVALARCEIDRELYRLEYINPTRDARQTVQDESLRLIGLPDKVSTVPGIDNKALEVVRQRYAPVSVFGSLTWPFVFVTEIMAPSQHQRFARQMSRYMVPYNRYVFAHYQRIAILRLFKDQVRVGITMNEMAKKLNSPSWLREKDIEVINTLAGRIPVKITSSQTTFVIRVPSNGVQREAGIYIRLRENISSADLKNTLVKGIISRPGYIEVADIAYSG